MNLSPRDSPVPGKTNAMENRHYTDTTHRNPDHRFRPELGFTAPADNMSEKDIVVGLLEKGLGQGDRGFIASHVAEEYTQHNPQAADRREGLLGFLDFLETLDPTLA